LATNHEELNLPPALLALLRDPDVRLPGDVDVVLLIGNELADAARNVMAMAHNALSQYERQNWAKFRDTLQRFERDNQRLKDAAVMWQKLRDFYGGGSKS
jgi:hypothetical protein